MIIVIISDEDMLTKEIEHSTYACITPSELLERI